MAEFIDPVFATTSPKRSFSMTENVRFGLVFVNTGSINTDAGGIVYWDEQEAEWQGGKTMVKISPYQSLLLLI